MIEITFLIYDQYIINSTRHSYGLGRVSNEAVLNRLKWTKVITQDV
jgi:hypothetical protein